MFHYSQKEVLEFLNLPPRKQDSIQTIAATFHSFAGHPFAEHWLTDVSKWWTSRMAKGLGTLREGRLDEMGYWSGNVLMGSVESVVHKHKYCSLLG